jgi:negative regulator of sigma E activity
LLKRLTRDPELRQSFGRYALIGETLRGASRASLSLTFAARVNRAIDGEPAAPLQPAARARPLRWWKPIAGTAVPPAWPPSLWLLCNSGPWRRVCPRRPA